MAKGKSFVQPEAVQINTEENKFLLEEHRKNCLKLYGVTSSTFAGATADLQDGEYSIAEIKQHIKEWKNKEVK